MNEMKLTGGAKIGMLRASFPLATLKVNKDKLQLKAAIIGNLVFQPKDIISIEPFKQIPIIGQGIRITHRVANYSQKVIFWTFQNPDEVLKQIKETGFLDNIQTELSSSDLEIIEKQKQGSFPVKLAVAIGAVILWNLLFAIDLIGFANSGGDGMPFGIGAFSAIGVLFGSAVLALVSSDFRNIILKEGREVEDIKSGVYLVIAISGLLLLSLGIAITVIGN